MEGVLDFVIPEGWQLPPPLPWSFRGSPCAEGNRSSLLGYGECRSWDENTPKPIPSLQDRLHPSPWIQPPTSITPRSPPCIPLMPCRPPANPLPPLQSLRRPCSPSGPTEIPFSMSKTPFLTNIPSSQGISGAMELLLPLGIRGSMSVGCASTWKCTPRHFWGQMEVLS